MGAKGTITTSDYMPFEEYQRLVNTLESEGQYKWAAYCLLSFCLALRVGDTLNLRWKDLLDQCGIVVKEQKTGKVKYIPIGERTANHMIGLYNKIGKPDPSTNILLNKYGKPMSKQYVNRKLKSWKKDYNLRIGNFSSHTFRKTFGRYVYNKMGKTQEAVLYLNRIFRHSSLQTTMIYLGIRDDEIGQIFSGIDI